MGVQCRQYSTISCRFNWVPWLHSTDCRWTNILGFIRLTIRQNSLITLHELILYWLQWHKYTDTCCMISSELFRGVGKCVWKMCEKCLKDCLFLTKGHFWNLEFMLFSGKFYSFAGKIWYMRKIFGYIRKIFFIFKKKCDISGEFFLVCPEKMFETPPPRRQLFREKNFRCPFLFGKCPLKPAPPNF
jgi:hypothetical protein